MSRIWPTLLATRQQLMREMPDAVRRAAIAAAPNVLGHDRMVERARQVQARDEARRSGGTPRC